MELSFLGFRIILFKVLRSMSSGKGMNLGFCFGG